MREFSNLAWLAVIVAVIAVTTGRFDSPPTPIPTATSAPSSAKSAITLTSVTPNQIRIGRLAVGMTSEQVLAQGGPPAERIPTKAPRVEVWDYPDASVLFENDRLTQVLGASSHSVFAQDVEVPTGLTLAKFCEVAGLSEEDLSGGAGGSYQVDIDGGYLGLHTRSEKITSYGVTAQARPDRERPSGR